MCSFVSPLQTKTKFVILMHPKEFKKVKNNTGFLTKESLPNSELFIGIDFSDNQRINEIIRTHKSYILFPSSDAINLSKEKPELGEEQNLAIFIIDTTWNCTRKIFALSKNIQTLPHISFESSKTSQYEIKVQPQSAYLSTIESTHVVLELLQQWDLEQLDKVKLKHFLNPFLEMVKYQKELIANPKSHAVRFRKKGFKK